MTIRQAVSLARNRHTDELVRLEEEAASEISALFGDVERDIRSVLLGLWIDEFGDIDVEPSSWDLIAWAILAEATIESKLSQLAEESKRVRADAALRAEQLGVRQFAEEEELRATP